MAQTAVVPTFVPGAKRHAQSDISGLDLLQIPGGGAQNVAGSPDGSIWITTAGAIFHYAGGVYTNIPGAATRISVAPDLSLWAINGGGGIYHYANGAWSTIAGGASDISVGADGSVYVISTVYGGTHGNGIWHYTNGIWTQLAGAAVRIAASWDVGTYPGIAPGGVYVVNAQDSIFYDDLRTGFIQIPGAAIQVVPTTRGGLFALGIPNGNIYYDNLATGTWTQQPGSAVSIGVNDGNVAVVNGVGAIYISATQNSVTEFGSGTAEQSTLYDIAAGPDGNIWFTTAADFGAGGIGRITPTGVTTIFTAGLALNANGNGIAVGADGNLYATQNYTSSIARITTAGVITQIPTTGMVANVIARGSDGNLWLTGNCNCIGRLTTAGVLTLFPVYSLDAPAAIAPGPDGNLWFTEGTGQRIGRITTTGVVSEFSAGLTPNASGNGNFAISGGPDGNVWFTEDSANKVARITPAGVITEFSAGITPNSSPFGITAGSDGNVWFTESAGRIGRITPAGVVTEFSAGISQGANPDAIVLGPGGNLWFTEFTGDRIGRI